MGWLGSQCDSSLAVGNATGSARMMLLAVNLAAQTSLLAPTLPIMMLRYKGRALYVDSSVEKKKPLPAPTRTLAMTAGSSTACVHP